MVATHLIVLIDKSYSMERYKSKLVLAFNKLLSDLRMSNYVLTVSMFNETLHYMCKWTPIGYIGDVKESDFVFTGGTAFYDTVGDVFNEMECTLDNPTQLFIITDGEDNCSTRLKKSDIDEMCRVAESRAWTIVHCDTEGSKLDVSHKVKFNNDNIDELFSGMSI